jgi:hypothetical protein
VRYESTFHNKKQRKRGCRYEEDLAHRAWHQECRASVALSRSVYPLLLPPRAPSREAIRVRKRLFGACGALPSFSHYRQDHLLGHLRRSSVAVTLLDLAGTSDIDLKVPIIIAARPLHRSEGRDVEVKRERQKIIV